jgi:hypothetical protein
LGINKENSDLYPAIVLIPDSGFLILFTLQSYQNLTILNVVGYYDLINFAGWIS